MIGIPEAIKKGPVCFFLPRHIPCTLLGGAKTQDQALRHS